MPGFLYFIERPAVSFDALKEIGLDYAFNPQGITTRSCNGGPDGEPGGGPSAGIVFARAEASGEEIGYFPDKQTWVKSVSGAFWIGHAKDRLPGPEDLKRKETVALYSNILGDERRWLLPTALLANGESPLPKVRRLKEDGSIERVVVERFKPLYLDADRVASAFRAKEPISEADEWKICVRALQTNYYVGPDEVSLLGLLSDQAVANIYSLLVERQNWPDVAALREGD